MAQDELDMARRFQADLRKLLTQYPRLTTAEGQARLNGYMSTQIDTEENVMPTKDHRSLGEDLVPLAVRIPVSIIPEIDAHVARMRRQHRFMRIGRSDALRDLIIRACDAIAAEEAVSGVSLATKTSESMAAAVQAIPQQPDLEAEPELPLEPEPKEAVPPVEPAASIPATVSSLDTPEAAFTVDLDTDATEDDQAATVHAVKEEPQPSVAPKAVKPRQRASRKKARV